MTRRTEARLLLVDDEEDVLQAKAITLGDEYETLLATSGSEALEMIDDSVDVVFLDRRMPGMTGRETLEAIREEGYETPVCMVTAVEPDVDIIEMPFDDYIVKPVERATLQEKIDVLTSQTEFISKSRELYRLDSKRKSLESAGLNKRESEEYQRLLEEIEALRSERDEDWMSVQEF